MWIVVNWAMLILATLIAGAAAVTFYWLLLRVTVAMMRPASMHPATFRPVPVRTELAHGTADLARAFTPRRSAQSQEGSK